MVDVELFVQGGAPRAAFTPEPTTAGSMPFFSVDVEMLRRAGWVGGSGTGWTPPPRSRHVPDLHPYGLGPMWAGSTTWHAEFVVGGRTLHCTIDHELISVHLRNGCDPGPPLASASPWLWHIAEQQAHHCGRSESPLEAAAAVEELMRGAVEFEPTMTRLVDGD